MLLPWLIVRGHITHLGEYNIKWFARDWDLRFVFTFLRYCIRRPLCFTSWNTGQYLLYSVFNSVSITLTLDLNHILHIICNWIQYLTRQSEIAMMHLWCHSAFFFCQQDAFLMSLFTLMSYLVLSCNVKNSLINSGSSRTQAAATMGWVRVSSPPPGYQHPSRGPLLLINIISVQGLYAWSTNSLTSR